MLFDGFVRASFPEGTSLARQCQLVGTLIVWLLIIYWFVLDARLRRLSLYKVVAPLWFLVPLIAAPIYFWRTRGRDKWKSMGKSVLFFLLLSLIGGIGASVAQAFMTHRI